ncbi:MAG: lipopolysaccharide kinase InaA family protein [Halioglobus sp.]
MRRRARILRGKTWAALLRDELARSTLGTDEWMEQHVRILRSDANSRSGLLRLEDQACFVKLYRIPSRWRRTLLGLGSGRPLRSFKAARDLRARGVAVPRPLACLLVREGMLLLSEGLSGDGNLAELWRQQPPGAPEAMAMMRSIGENLALLHRSGYAHGSCRWGNLVWDGRRVYLVDLDRAFKSPLGSMAQAQDLARFTLNAEERHIGPQNYELFLSAYLQGIDESRRVVIERMLPFLYRFRDNHLVDYGAHGQRLV